MWLGGWRNHIRKSEIRFETYMGQEGYTARDLMIAEQRFVA